MILFLNGEYPFCYHYRGYLPGVYGNQLVVDYMRPDKEKIKQLIEKADTVVFQRPSKKEHVSLMRSVKALGKKVIFENDDTYHAIPLERLGNERQKEIAIEMANTLDEALMIADGAIASTEILADEYRKINKNTIVLKNCIDPLDKYQCNVCSTAFRVGFIGSVTTNDDYIHIKDQIRQMDEMGITIVVMGVKYKDGTHLPIMQEDFDFWNSLNNVEWNPYVPVNEYMQKVASLALDVVIIPRKEHYFNQCKSNLKFLEMSLLKIPVIAQGFMDGSSPYQGVDEDYMTVIVDNTLWFDTVNMVKSNYDQYKALALKAHEYVLENYNIKNYAQEWVQQINNL